MPLPRKVNLTWLGWSTEGASPAPYLDLIETRAVKLTRQSPVMADSTGVLSQLDRYRRPGQGRWVPVLDGATLSKERRGEKFWPVGVTGSALSCISLKVSDSSVSFGAAELMTQSTEKEPWFPRPLLQNVDLQVPLLSMDGQTGKLEESYVPVPTAIRC